MEAPGEKRDVSVIIAFFRGTASEFQMLRSVVKAVAWAAARGVRVQIVAVAAAQERKTVSRWLEEHVPDALLLEGTDQDRCRLWNRGTHAAAGEFISLIAGGDLICEDWILEAHAQANKNRGQKILHPRHSLTFGRGYAARLHEVWNGSDRSVVSTPLDPSRLGTTLFGPAVLFRTYPFMEDQAFSTEARERHWFFRLIERSIPIEPVAETACFLRREDDEGVFEPVPASPLFSPARCRERLGWSEESTETVAISSPSTPEKRLKPLQRIARTVLPDSVRLPVNRALNRIRDWTSPCQTDAASGDQDRRVPPPLVEHWRAIHAVEPGLFPTPEALREANRPAPVPQTALSDRFIEFMAELPSEPSHLFLVRCVRQGGADRVLLNYLRALAETAPDCPVAVVATDPYESDWRRMLPGNATLIDFGLRTTAFCDEDRVHLLASILTQTAPRVIHNIHSRIGYEVFARYGKELNARSRLFGDFFSAGVTEDGRRVSEAFDYAPRVYPHMTAFLSDHERFLAGLAETYGFAADRLQTVYQPAPREAEPREAALAGSATYGPSRPLRKILWASRLDREKFPELLVEIAKACAGEPFEFHAFGTSLYRETPFQFEPLSNLTYHGGYDGFETLRPREYDAFLYTTLWDGLPNVLLEAAAAGLPLIAPDVGGIREFVVHDETGILISACDDAGAYAAALRRIAANPERATEYAEGARTLLNRRHSWRAYLDRLQSLPDWGLEPVPDARPIPLQKAC